MSAQYKLAFLGIDKPEEDEGDLVGIRVYNTLPLDKITDIIKNHGPKGYLNDSLFSISPNKKRFVLCSGREPGFTSRIEVQNLVENIDILIISACTELVFARSFLSWLTPEVLPKSCAVVIRHPYDGEERPVVPYHSSWWLEDMELSGEREERSFFKRFRKMKRKTFIFGASEYGGESLDKGLPLLQNYLIQMKPSAANDQLSKPVKETFTASRSILTSISNWIYGKS